MEIDEQHYYLSFYCLGDTTPKGNLVFCQAERHIRDISSFDSKGKILLSHFSFPTADAIYVEESNTINRQFLREYLSFLEVIVLYEELLVVNQPYFVTTEDYENESSPIWSTFPYFDYAGDANLLEAIEGLRSTESWIIDTAFHLPEIESNATYFAALSRTLAEPYPEHRPHAEDLYSDVFFTGQPLAAWHVAKILSMPFYGPKIESHPLVEMLENRSSAVELSVSSILRDRLDSGA